MNQSIQTTINKALNYIKLQQEPDGGFTSSSSSTQMPFRSEYIYHTTFTPALLLSALSHCKGEVAHTIRTNLAQFLIGQKSAVWSFNYWARTSGMTRQAPYPDDLDDTFCSLSALYLHDPTIIDETALAAAIKLLIAVETQIGGPYRTWLVPSNSPQVWQDVDIAVNANVAYFLSLTADTLPHLVTLMEKAIEQQKFISPYYPTEYPILYYLARVYKGPLTEQLVAYIRGRRYEAGHWESPLHTALAVSSLLRLDGTGIDSAIRYLIDTQEPDGSWKAEAFCLDPIKDRQTFYSGSETLTTAFVIEALQLYQNLHTQVTKTTTKRQGTTLPLQKTITAQAIGTLELLDHDLSRLAIDRLQRTIRDSHSEEIILLPYLFHHSLKNPKNLSKQLFIDLGLANLYGWTAYTIYDDFLDQEGEAQFLPAANLLARYSLEAFNDALPKSPSFQTLVRTTFNAMDAANTWEIVHCRCMVSGEKITIDKLPSYEKLDKLAERSLGHTLTPLGILAAMDIAPDDPIAQMLQTALRHYIIARQLNDDAHDWREDLIAGRITYVLAIALEELGVLSGQYPLDTLLHQVESQFWHHTLVRVCKTISRHTHLSRKALTHANLPGIEDTLELLLTKIDLSVKETLETVSKTEKFLDAYTRST